MSYSKNQKNKKRRQSLTAEQKRVKRLIRSGELPQYYLVKDTVKHPTGKEIERLNKQVRGKRSYLTLKQESTYLKLTK